jgi:hypothetical protein
VHMCCLVYWIRTQAINIIILIAVDDILSVSMRKMRVW